MKKTLLLLFIPFLGFGQSNVIKAKLIQTIEVQADEFIGYDNFDSFYYTLNNVLCKKTKDNFYQYQNLQYGKITKVDLVNPLRILVFYAEFNSAVLLDNQFNEIQSISFSQLETPTIVSAIGLSGQNKLWIYNTTDQQIGLYDLSSKTIKNLNVPIKEKFTFYQTDLNYFHWIDFNSIWHTSTIFGNVTTNGKIISQQNLQIKDSEILIYEIDNAVFIENTLTKNKYQISGIENSFKKMFYKDQILSIFTNNKILRYKIILP